MGTVQTGSGKVDPARKFKCTTTARETCCTLEFLRKCTQARTTRNKEPKIMEMSKQNHQVINLCSNLHDNQSKEILRRPKMF